MIDILIEKIKEKNNPTVAGLDPKLDYLPQEMIDASFEKYGATFEGAADAILDVYKRQIPLLPEVQKGIISFPEKS